MKKSRIIGVTGCMGSGKSTLIHLLAKEIPVIDCDSINAGLLKKDHTGWKALKEAGLLAMSETGETDKPEMARRMFSNPAYKKQVEDILQPLIIEEMDHWKEGITGLGAIEVPLLFECHLQDHFDSIWCVLADDDVAIRRLREGRNISEEQARERLAYQFPPTKKAELSNEVLYNNGTIEELKEQMDQLLKKEVSALDRTDS